MLTFQMNLASELLLVQKKRKEHRYDINELLVAANMAFCRRRDFDNCGAEKAGASVGEDGE